MSSELKLDSSSQVIKSDNKDLIFKLRRKPLSNSQNQKKEDKNIYIGECYIKIENLSNNYVALRIRTTKKNYYGVYPIYSIISPRKIINIKIIYNSKPNEVITSLGHKFRFEGFIIDEKEKNTKDILGLFHQYIKDQKIVKGNYIKKNVVFIRDNYNINNNVNINTPKQNKINFNKNQKINTNINGPLRGINKSKLNLNEKIEQEIKQCNELRNIHQNLIKQLYEMKLKEKEKENINNKNSIIDTFKEGKELLMQIKNNKIFSGLVISLFLASTIMGFYLTI